MALPVTMLVPADPEAMSWALEGLVALDCGILRRSRGRLPRLYDSGVRYKHQMDPKRWANIVEVLRAGYADCKNLAAWRCAELRFYDALPAVVHCYQTGARRWHAVVALDGEVIEDPSRALGMKGAS